MNYYADLSKREGDLVLFRRRFGPRDRITGWRKQSDDEGGVWPALPANIGTGRRAQTVVGWILRGLRIAAGHVRAAEIA